MAASSSPVIFSRVREVGAWTGAGMVEGEGRDLDGADAAGAVVKWHWTKVACLEVETGRVQICAIQEVNI